ncbi:nitroreductase family protein [Actinokineospora sp. PR83]|uniref:Acg family FMN-binding oxidoreductase n=1 Tax=Actinokineospora sp. PR83 TaxID=2884908 RepID=UPI0027E0BAAB|nr:nitroreductase family protein [Actinokineospora sp. PR83]MCG8915555.1 nitroreductase family protein [Actinokineospora sp. PR83]
MSADVPDNNPSAVAAVPDEETLRAAVRMACWAPSVHNTQPWRWRLSAGAVHLFADRDRALPATDPDGRDLLISCGAALHHLRVALAAFGWATSTTRMPDRADPDHLAAVTTRRAVSDQGGMADAVAITRRHSDRRAYTSRALDRATLDVLVERAAREGVVAEVVRSTGARRALRVLIAEADRRQSADDRYLGELARWSGRPAGSPDGVPARSTPAATRVGDLVVREFSAPALLPSPGADNGGELLVLGTGSDDGESRLRAGEATSAVLLAATALRLATCPLTQPMEVPEIRELLRTAVLAADAVPQIILRVGWPAPGSGELPHTPRRSPDSVLDARRG